jgi:secondary thiamine-phosphate synthase enzyme
MWRWSWVQHTASGFSQDGDFPMTAHTETFSIKTHGKGTTEITREVAGIVTRAGITHGTVTVFVKHTSASLVIMENADPSARRDMEEFFEKLVPESTPWFIHTQEGPDDMPGHIHYDRADDLGDLAGNFPVRTSADSASARHRCECGRRMS